MRGRVAIGQGLLMLAAACSSPSASPAPSGTEGPTGEATPPVEASLAEASPSNAEPVVEAPDGLLAPGSVATTLVDGLRVRAGPPGTSEHEDIVDTLNTGDEVFVEWTPLAYRAPSETPDGRGWYQVRLGGPEMHSGVSGWVAAGEEGLEYFEMKPVACTSTGELDDLIYATGDRETLRTPWERLACFGGRELVVSGVLDYVCPEGGIYPYTFAPYLAYPQWCSALMIDAIGADGYPQYEDGLILRTPDFRITDRERGDVLRVRGGFDDPASDSCSADTEPGFDGADVDGPFLVLFCREQFVQMDSELVDHRELGPSPWGP